METSWDRLKRQLQEFYQAAAEKSDELARIGARKIDLVSLRRHLSREMVALGSRVYELIEKEKSSAIAEDPEVLRRIESARRLEAEVARREIEIEEIRTSAAERRTLQPGQEPGPGEGDATGGGPSF